MKIVVVGSINLDLITTANRFPKIGETLIGTSSMVSPGGKGANQAVAASKLGADVTLIGCVGTDAYADILMKNFEDVGVNTAHIEVVAGSSGTAQITIAENDNSIIIVPGANAFVSKDLIDKNIEVIKAADLVITQFEIPIDTVTYLLDKCNEFGVKTILNPAPAANISKDEILKATFITPNEIELEQIFNETATTVLKRYPNKVIMTFGSKGVLFHDGIKEQVVPSYKVDVVDTTGAGDTFNAAFAVEYCRSKDIISAIAYGNLAASKTVQGLGAQSSMPYESELKVDTQ